MIWCLGDWVINELGDQVWSVSRIRNESQLIQASYMREHDALASEMSP
jgi:hypothetical protein